MIIGCGEATLTQTGSGIALLRERFKEQRSRMLTAEKRAQILPVWAGLASVIAIDFLTSNFWTALLIGACVGGSVVLARAFADAKQRIIRQTTTTKVSDYEQIYQAHVRGSIRSLMRMPPSTPRGRQSWAIHGCQSRPLIWCA